MCRHFFKLLLIIFLANFPFISISYKGNVSFNVDNVKSIHDKSSLIIMNEDISNYGQKVFISVSVASNHLILTLISQAYSPKSEFSYSQSYSFRLLQFFYIFA